jgi:DNA polymerase elongation subunit (family B)
MAVQLLASEVRARKKGWPELCLFGRSEAGESVSIVIPNSKPSLLVKTNVPKEYLQTLVLCLSKRLNDKVRYRDYELTSFIRMGELRELWGVRQLAFLGEEVYAREFYGYDPVPSKFYRIELPDPSLVYKARTLLLGCAGNKTGEPQWLEDEVLHRFFPRKQEELRACKLALRQKRADGPWDAFAFRVAEANLELGMAQCNVLGITPGGWIQAPDREVSGSYKRTNVAKELEGRPTRVEKDGNAPVRVLSWDIEVITKDLGGGATQFFDGDSLDAKLLCISAVWYEHGRPATTSATFSLAPEAEADEELKAADDPNHSFTARWFTSEVALLEAFCDFLVQVDPDVVTGYNINGFDIPWLLKRSEALGIQKPMPIGRLNKTGITEVPGDSPRIPYLCPGRTMMDLYTWVKKNRQLRQYNLNYVAEEYLGMKKMDVAYSEIGMMQETREGRLKLAQYCELDSRLVCSLFRCKKLDVLNRELAVSLVCNVFLQDLNAKGTQNLLRGKLIGAAHTKGFVLPFEPALGDAELEDAEYEVRLFVQLNQF